MEKTYKILKLLIWVLLFAVLMIGAYTLYNRLSGEMKLGGVATVAPGAEAAEAAGAEAFDESKKNGGAPHGLRRFSFFQNPCNRRKNMV